MVLQQALADLNTAYRNFFASVTGKRKGPKIAPPRFRSRKDRQAGHPVHPQRPVQITAGREAAAAEDRGRAGALVPRLPSEPSSVTVILDAAGRYFARSSSRPGMIRFPRRAPRPASTWG